MAATAEATQANKWHWQGPSAAMGDSQSPGNGFQLDRMFRDLKTYNAAGVPATALCYNKPYKAIHLKHTHELQSHNIYAAATGANVHLVTTSGTKKQQLQLKLWVEDDSNSLLWPLSCPASSMVIVMKTKTNKKR